MLDCLQYLCTLHYTAHTACMLDCSQYLCTLQYTAYTACMLDCSQYLCTLHYTAHILLWNAHDEQVHLGNKYFK